MAKHLLRLPGSNGASYDEASVNFGSDDTLVVMNKVDLVQASDHRNSLNVLDEGMLARQCEGAHVCHISCKTGEGVDSFMRKLEGKLKKMYAAVIKWLNHEVLYIIMSCQMRNMCCCCHDFASY